ncbi:MAG TPA: ankyrin repeat domain-containing protein [Rectinemataceae bacterium]|nr:ankyrin repeat domain-containing protein [Rectinemataceae bacterium]
MKLAVLASRADRSSVEPLLSALKAIDLPAFGLAIGPGWVNLEREAIKAHLGGAGHLILVADARSAADSWFGYAIGYATGLPGGFSLYRQDPSWEPPPYIRGAPLFDDLEELRNFFSIKKAEWEGEEKRESARNRLLALGISCTADSFAACCSEGDTAAVRLFLQAGFDPDARDRHGVPMLGLAVRKCHLAVAEALLDEGASIDLKSEDRGYTALLDAVKAGPPEHVAFFLSRGAGPNVESKDGQSALVLAVGKKDLASARLLLEHGADPDLADKLGMSARSYAKLFKMPEFATLFEEFPPVEPY